VTTHRGGCHCGKLAFEADVDGGRRSFDAESL
jgi:hypothetical protein